MAKLTLIPTPLNEEMQLEPVALELLRNLDAKKQRVLVEETKPAIRRWIRWGLPRESVQDFLLYNEHSSPQDLQAFLKILQQGTDLYLLSDGGLPGFCDPGASLIELCHQEKIVVTATPFCNSPSLAWALSGFPQGSFVFEGFPPREKVARTQSLQRSLESPLASIWMDTPYRLESLVVELAELASQQRGVEREIFLATELQKPEESCLRGSLKEVRTAMKRWPSLKREFVLILGPAPATRRR